MNKIVARYQDGNVLKGTTNDFLPNRDAFHLTQAGAPAGTKPTDVRLQDLKAVFFVKDLAGSPSRSRRNEFDPHRPAPGRKIRVAFKDGEILVGTTQGYQPGRPGFFVVPADGDSNNERCFVLSAAASDVSFL
jgi:hypothetical protein